MQNFQFYNPTKVLFGKGQIANIVNEIPKDAKIMMTYGGGSIKKNGVYDQVKAALSGFKVVEFGGIEPNPHYETLMQAVEKARQEKVDFLLAVGGGSVSDGTKFIAAAIPFIGDPWDFYVKGTPVTKALPVGVVLTLPATGSEMNGNAVVTKFSTREKRPLKSDLLFPKFSVLDPESTYSLPNRQIANGIVDAFTHVMEQYLTMDVNTPVQDRFAEGILQTLISEGPKSLNDPKDYDARSNLIWSATMALNGLLACGTVQDWTTHMIGHQLTALHNMDHARTLAIVLPAVMHVKRDKKQVKLLQYAERVWGIKEGDVNQRIDRAIAKTREFFEAVGNPTTMDAYDLDESHVQPLVDLLVKCGFTALGEHQDITPEVSKEILDLCVHKVDYVIEEAVA